MVNNTILIGKYVYQFLSEDEELNKMVNGNIYPLISDEDVNFPFIIYGRDSLTPNYVKDFPCQDSISMRFHIASDNYSESLDIANKVRHILECKRFKNDEIFIQSFRVDNISEYESDDAYIQTIYMTAVCGSVE